MSKIFKHDNAIEWFKEFVSIDSETFNETGMVDFIEKRVKSLKWNCEIIRQKIDLEKDVPENVKRRMPNVNYVGTTEQIYVVFPATDTTKPTIFFSSHLDVVKPGIGVKPIFENGIIKTDGTTVLGADDKAGLADMFAGMELIIKNKIPHGKVVFICTAMEEIGLVGSKLANVDDFGIKYGYVLDMDDRVGTIISKTLHTQHYTIDLDFDAPKAMGAGPWGENIYTYASELVRMMPRGTFSKDTFGSAGISKMTFEQPTEMRKPCVKGSISGSIMSILPEEITLMRQQISAMIEHHKRDSLVVSIKFTPEKTSGYCVYDTEDGKQLVKNAEKAITSMGLKFKDDKSRGGFDANEFNLKGIPTLVLSCGFMKQHTTDEYIVEQDLHDGAELVKRLIELG